MTRVAIIADDLTGALDTASPFACRGAKTVCFTSAEAIDVEAARDADVISVSTNTRHMVPHIAAAIVRAAAEKIRQLSPDIVLKKIDSRLKGNVSQEADAVASVFGFDRLLVLPAAPDIGRYVSRGAVEGVGVDVPIAVATRFSGSAYICDIPDVLSSEAMAVLSQSILQNRTALTVCSRGLAVALAECLFADSINQNTSLEVPHLVAIGSRDPITTEQQKAICSSGLFECVEAPDGRVAEPLPTTTQLLLHCTGSLQSPSDIVAKRFAEGVVRAAAFMKPNTMLCSGGDTASAVLKALGQTFLQIIGEAAPGLPMSRITLAGQEMVFISKSGGFGGPAILLEVFANQQGSTRPKVHEFNGP